MFKPLLRRVLESVGRSTDLDAAAGYDLWSGTYDTETDNLLIALDERVFGSLLERIDLRERRVIDVGCGTGRHWEAILSRGPTEIVGYDISQGMLGMLRRKYPGASRAPGERPLSARCTRRQLRRSPLDAHALSHSRSRRRRR